MESTKHHFMEEERKIFPKAKKVLQGELDRLGEEMDTLEKQMTG
jgi:hemerythrin-like domain-containing protein